MQFDPMRPIWLQVMGEIETGIVTGAHPPGAKLPGGRELAVQYGINPNTAARGHLRHIRRGEGRRPAQGAGQGSRTRVFN